MRWGQARAYLREDLDGVLERDRLIDWGASAAGEIVREAPGRRTLRLTLEGRPFYLKYHEGVGVNEVLKNWLTLKRPVLGADNELAATRHLRARGVVAPRVAAFAVESGPPLGRRSLLLTDALDGWVDLETLTADWPARRPPGRELRALVMQVAAAARALHGAGVVHRDFYLCHLLRAVGEPARPLGVLDLHRALVFEALPERWRRRDLAALLYSALDLPLSRRGWLRFVRAYSGVPLKRAFAEDGAFWRSVHARALALHAKGVRKGLVRVP